MRVFSGNPLIASTILVIFIDLNNDVYYFYIFKAKLEGARP